MKKKDKTSNREMMELAIKVMGDSVGESRDDGKPNPHVGAVLVYPDGSTKTACRGELRAGNHAEFTLLERKCIGDKLDDCVLFATLEPCLNRNHPKRGCARHIVSARIKKVFVGIEDDNPTVAGKGIQYLRDHGVEIEMFDRDLQEVILKENKTFFEWARQQTEKPEEKPIQLSKYEEKIGAVEWQDLSEEALKLYRARVGIEAQIGSSDFSRQLVSQGLLIAEDDAFVPSGFGYLLFGKDTRLAMPQSGLLARAQFANEKAARKEFSMPMVLLPRAVEKWLNEVLPKTLKRDQMERKEQVELPFDMLREAVVNALIHRNYDLGGEKCQLIVTPNYIRVRSPGRPIEPITLDMMNDFSVPMRSRNPILHFVMARVGMAEEQGFGLVSLREEAVALGIPLPKYSYEDPYLDLTIYRTQDAQVDDMLSELSDEIRNELSDEELAGWLWMTTQGPVSKAEYVKEMKVPQRTAERHLKHLSDLGIVTRSGSGPSTRYEA